MSTETQNLPKSKKSNVRRKKVGFYTSLDLIKIPARLRTVLKKNGVDTIGDLALFEFDGIEHVKGFGGKSISTIQDVLYAYGYRVTASPERNVLQPE